MKNNFREILDFYVPVYKCELNYNKDYELLIATVLSAQCTDKRVNMVTEELFKKFDIFSLAKAKHSEVEKIIRPCGSQVKKSNYVINIAIKLTEDFNGVVPNNREYLESLPGVGHKTCNVVLRNLFKVPCIAVDTHVMRVSKRLGLADEKDSPYVIEKKLMEYIPQDEWNKIGEQLLLFGRYHCKSINPMCLNCKFKKMCQKK